MYVDKAIRAIGKIEATAVAKVKGKELIITEIVGKCDNMEKRILAALNENKNNGNGQLGFKEHRYFFVEQFYKTNYLTHGYGFEAAKIFDLCDELGCTELPDTEEIANLLCKKTWKSKAK